MATAPDNDDSPPPPPGRLTQLALNILEEAAKEAAPAPIERLPSHRLALAWLCYADIAKRWQVDQFWQILGEPFHPIDTQRAYVRTTHFNGLLNRWRLTAFGPEPPLTKEQKLQLVRERRRD